MDFSLWHPLDVVVGWVRGLLCEQQHDPLKHLVTIESSGGHVEEQPVQHCLGDVGQNILQECQSYTYNIMS